MVDKKLLIFISDFFLHSPTHRSQISTSNYFHYHHRRDDPGREWVKLSVRIFCNFIFFHLLWKLKIWFFYKRNQGTTKHTTASAQRTTSAGLKYNKKKASIPRVHFSGRIKKNSANLQLKIKTKKKMQN